MKSNEKIEIQSEYKIKKEEPKLGKKVQALIKVLSAIGHAIHGRLE